MTSFTTDPLFILETERLWLRRQRVEDVAFLTDLWSDAAVTRYMGGPRERSWLHSVFTETAAHPFADAYDLWPLMEKMSGLPVGHCGLLDKEVEGKAEIELTYVLAQPSWGKGYAVEIGRGLMQYAFSALKLQRLIALIEPDNPASARTAEKIGFHFEKDVLRPGNALRHVYAIEKNA